MSFFRLLLGPGKNPDANIILPPSKKYRIREECFFAFRWIRFSVTSTVTGFFRLANFSPCFLMIFSCKTRRVLFLSTTVRLAIISTESNLFLTNLERRPFLSRY